MSDSLRIGIIGAGHIANAHAEAFARFPEHCIVVAVCDPDEERASATARKHGLSAHYSGLETMLENEHLDAVIVCTPTYLHGPQTLACLRAGAHVLCEKPMGMTIGECEQMTQAADRAGKRIAIGFNHRLFGKFLKLKQILESMDVGELVSVVGAIGHGGWRNHYGTWFTERRYSGGGAFLTCGIHLIDLLHWYGFAVDSVFATMQQRFLDGDCEDDSFALLRFANGALGSIHASYAWTHNYAQVLRLNFVNASVDVLDDCIMLSREKGNPERIGFSETDSFALQARAFLDAIAGKSPVFVTPVDGARALAVAMAAYESERTQSWVSVPQCAS